MVFKSLYGLADFVGRFAVSAASNLFHTMKKIFHPLPGTALKGILKIRTLFISGALATKGFFNRLLNDKAFAKSFASVAAPCAAALILTFTIWCWVGVSFVLKVSVGDKTLGFINNSDVYYSATALADEKILIGNFYDYVEAPTFTLAVAKTSDVIDAEILSEKLVSSSEDLVLATCLYSDDEILAATNDTETINLALNRYLSSVTPENKNGVIEFLKKPSIKSGYVSSSAVVSSEMLTAKVEEDAEKFALCETATITKTEEIPFVTVKTETASLLKGTTQVKTKGEKGTLQITTKVICINGVETKNSTLSTEIIKEPVNEEILVGTAKAKRITSASTLSASGAEALSWPVSSSVYSYVSDGFGGNRGHSGIDIAGKYGSPICAAAAGTVVEVMDYSMNSYGLYVVIDHGNGVKTRYAHCSSISISLGDTVSAGDVIGYTGTTGRTTGPHLHFEYILNGCTVNPAPYLGIN